MSDKEDQAMMTGFMLFLLMLLGVVAFGLWQVLNAFGWTAVTIIVCGIVLVLILWKVAGWLIKDWK